MPNLIVADDDPDLTMILCRVAEEAGWTVFTFPDGDELVSFLGQLDAPAFVLVDVDMPTLNGIEVAQRLRDLPNLPRIRLRFMTGGHFTSAVAATLIAKARDFDPGLTLYKPFSIEEFRKVLRSEAMRLA